MPLQVPADLEASLSGAPSARVRFDRLPPESKDAWIAWVNRARSQRARERRIQEFLRRLAPAPAAATVEEEVAPPLPPRQEWWPWLLALALLLLVAALLVWLLVYRDNGNNAQNNVVVQKGTVPNVIGQKQAPAVQAVRQAGLSPAVVQRQASRPAGTVFGQRPPAGKVVKDGSVVTLIVSRGPPPVAVPDVQGLAAADAVSQLQGANLSPKLVETKSEKTAGTVISQKPAAGAKLAPGSAVTLTVSRGTGKVTVPAVVGETASTATAELRAAGLKAQTSDVASNQPKGAVVAQSPRGGEAVVRGATVSLEVSRGAAAPTTTTRPTTVTQPATTTATTAPAPTTTQATGTPTPALVGKGIVTALGMLERAGLLANVEYQSSQSPLGQVRSQDPRPGTRVAPRTRVQVIVSEGPNPGAPTDVPDVTGQDQATARSTLEDAGFTVAVIHATVRRASTGEPGTVVEQQPAAGGAIAAGDYVVIYVSS